MLFDHVTGVSLGFWQDRDPLEARATARLADQFGYRDLWLGEMATYDVFALATAIGLSTATIRLVVGPVSPAVRDPMMLALGVASVAALTDRSVDLALGASSPVVVERWHGRTYAGATTLLRRAVGDLRPLLAGGRPATGGYRLRLPPVSSSITIAAFGPATIRLAGEVADRMVINLCTPAQAAALRRALDDATAAAGRDRIPLAAWVPAAVEPTDSALEQLRRALVPYLAQPGYGEMFTAAGFGELVDSARGGLAPGEILRRAPVELVSSVAAIGSLDDCRRSLLAHVEAGVDEVVIVPASADDPGGERTLGALAGPTPPVRDRSSWR